MSSAPSKYPDKEEMRKCLTLVNSTEQRSKIRKREPAARSVLRLRALCSVTIERWGATPSPDRAQGGASLLAAPPGRVVVVRGVVGNFDLTSSTRVDGVDLVVTDGCIPARVSYRLGARRIGKPAVVVGRVVGKLDLTSSARVDGVNLVVTVGSLLARVGYLLATG